MTDDTEAREAFEAWISHPDSPFWGILTKDNEGRYLEDDTHVAWVGWKAASRSLSAAAALLRANGYVVEEPKVKALSEEIVNRRFGREHVLPCKDPNTITCALYKCQISNECRRATCSGTGARPAGEKT